MESSPAALATNKASGATFGKTHRSVASLAAAVGTDVAVEVFSAYNTRLTSCHDADLIAALQRSNETVMISDPTTNTTTTTGSSGVYRNVCESQISNEELYDRRYGGPHKSLVASFKLKCQEFGDAKKAVAWRPLASVERAEQPAETVKKGQKPKKWEILHLGATQHCTYRELWEKMVAFGAGLAAPRADGGVALPPGCQVGIYSETRKEWMITCYGLWLQSYVGVTVYANLGEDALLYAIKEAEMKAIICSVKGAATVTRICMRAKIPTPTLIVLPELMVAAPSVSPSNSNVFAWEDVVNVGSEALRKKTVLAEKFPTSPDDTALIMYTSGTTGDPKGVVLSHGNIYAAVDSFNYRLTQYLANVKKEEQVSYVGFLPLAHILEFAAENCFLMGGAMVGYGTPRTLTSAAAKPCGDLEEFRPMFFVGVPRIFDTILKGVQAKIPSGLRGRLFERAYRDRLALYEEGRVVSGYDSTVFATTRATIGGRCRCVVSGGAPLSAKTQQYMSVIFGCPVVQGYGLTETCAIATLPSYWDMRTEVIGPVLPGIEMRLVDVDAWRHTDKPNPRGEIWLRGPTVTKGYYKQEAKTKEAFAEEGWLKTGDVGEMMPGGTLRIIGRVKSLAKNLNGEYVAMESLESIYVQHELALPNGVCVVVDSQKPFICALVCTDEAKAMAFAKKNKICEGASWPQILKDSIFQKKAAESLAAVAAKNGKKKFEQVQRVLVTKDEWTPENGILTAAMKLKRSAIDKQYKEEIAKLFSTDIESCAPADAASPTSKL